MLAPGLLLPTLVVVAAIALWAAGRLPEYLTALLFFTACLILGVARPDVVFSGFTSAAFWLVLSGFVIGTAIQKVGLADRIAQTLGRQLLASWPRLIAGLVCLSYLLAFVMPSNMGRITLMMPIALALADRAGLPEASRGRIGVALAVGFGTYELAGSVLPASVANLVLVGAAETAYGLHFGFLSFLTLQAPVLGVLRGLALIALITVLFRSPLQPRAEQPSPGPMTAAERRLAIVLGLTLLGWVTDTLHGVSPAWIGLAAACVCLLPRIGFLDGDEFQRGVNFRTCIYVAGILGLSAVVAETGLGRAFGEAVVAILPFDPARPATNFAGLSALAAALNFLVTNNGVPALFTPLAASLTDPTGFTLPTVLMTQVIAYSTPILPYQAAPLALVMALARVPLRPCLIVCLSMAAITFGLLMPLHFLWFRALGWL